MAKSIRSKWRQRMRNEKRKKNVVKEVDRLKKIAAEHCARMQKEKEELAQTTMDAAPLTTTDEPSSTAAKFNKKTMKDEEGRYPVWMNKRRIQKVKEKTSKKKKQQKKRL